MSASHPLRTIRVPVAEVQVEELAYELMASRLADVVFVHALRRHLKDHSYEAGWLRAVGDAHLGPAFQDMHARAQYPWTVETLARESAMSRSAFAAHFKEVLGEGPLACVTRWRRGRATELLGSGSHTVAEIARPLSASPSRARERQLTPRNFAMSSF